MSHLLDPSLFEASERLQGGLRTHGMLDLGVLRSVTDGEIDADLLKDLGLKKSEAQPLTVLERLLATVRARLQSVPRAQIGPDDAPLFQEMFNYVRRLLEAVRQAINPQPDVEPKLAPDFGHPVRATSRRNARPRGTIYPANSLALVAAE
jgi:hypothetical protein